MRILVVEDDRLLNNTLCYNLSTGGYEIDTALTKEAASDFYGKKEYDLIVLDVNLPDGSGFGLCREVKELHPDTAVIFLTANDMESDMLRGFELGADDYVTKPFPISVFRKKVSVLLSRIKKENGGDCYNDGNLSVNFSEMTATLSGESVAFTPLEYRLLKVLIKNPHIVLTREILLEKLWNKDSNFVDEHALTSAISRIRNKKFLRAMGSELDKLDFLMQAMIKTSWLETGVIELKKKCQPIYDTLAAALGSVLLCAEKKNINISVKPYKTVICHHPAWHI